MELKVVEQKEGKLVLEVGGESHTLLNLLRELCWKEGAEQVSYMVEHPYMSQPKLIIYGKNPKKILQAAAQRLIALTQEFLSEAKKNNVI